MSQLLKYTLTGGQIVGAFTSDQQAFVDAQVIDNDVTYGYLVPEVEIPDAELAQWEIVAGQVQAKTRLVLTAHSTPFPADGVAECAVTVVPFQPCSVSLNNATPVALTVEDPTLTLTAEAPIRWTAALVPQPGVWAEPITIEAV